MALRQIEEKPERLFAIGDIHGCFDELRLMLEFLIAHENFNKNDMLVFVGDYIDRGPNARAVVQYLVEFKESFPNTVFLKGNHEDMLLMYLSARHGNMRDSYLANGGLNTLESYNMPDDKFRLPHEEEEDLIGKHMSFFQKLESGVIIGDYVFVHAGVNPLRPLNSQVENDVLWIRDEFIYSAHNFGKTVVFGHTPYYDLFFDLPYKIGIDTGLVYGNMLSCIELGKKKAYQIDKGGEDVVERRFQDFLGDEENLDFGECQIQDGEEKIKS